jgi:hypothetical protein
MQHSIFFQSLETQNYSTGLYALLQQVTFKSDTKPKLRTELNLAVLGGDLSLSLPSNKYIQLIVNRNPYLVVSIWSITGEDQRV